MRLFCKREPSVLFYNASGFIMSAYSLILKYNVIRIYHKFVDVSFHIVASMYVRFRYSGKNPMRFAVFWRISVRFCGFRTPLRPPSVIIARKKVISPVFAERECGILAGKLCTSWPNRRAVIRTPICWHFQWSQAIKMIGTFRSRLLIPM